MLDYEEYIDFYLDQGDENAFHSLTDLDRSAFPIFAQRFRKSGDPHIRGMIIELISFFRMQEALPVFQDALRDPNYYVWNQAITGVLLADSPEAERILKEEIARCEVGENTKLNRIKLEFFREALQMMYDERKAREIFPKA